MISNFPDLLHISNRELKSKIMQNVSDAKAVQQAISSSRYNFRQEDAIRPNLFKARELAVAKRFEECNPSESWLKEIINTWSQMTGLPPLDADFWRSKNFMQSIKNGSSLYIRRYVDDQGWGWVSTYDSPTTWVHKRRLPEATTKYLKKKNLEKNRVLTKKS